MEMRSNDAFPLHKWGLPLKRDDFVYKKALEEKILLRAAESAGMTCRSQLMLRFKAGRPVTRAIYSFGHGSGSCWQRCDV